MEHEAKKLPGPLEIYRHYGYTEVDPDTWVYTDGGFPSGEYFTENSGPDTLERLGMVLASLRKDKRIRVVIDYDPDYEVAMTRYWGQLTSSSQA